MHPNMTEYSYYWFTPIVLLPSVALFIMSLMMKFSRVSESLFISDNLPDLQKYTLKKRLRQISTSISLLYASGAAFCLSSIIDLFIYFIHSRTLVIIEFIFLSVSILIFLLGLIYALMDITVVKKSCEC